MGDPRVRGVTITEVAVTPDLRMARVRVTRLGTDDDRKAALNGLKGAVGFLRHELGMRLALRCVPELTFFLDNTWQSASRIDVLLEQIRDVPSEGNEHEEHLASWFEDDFDKDEVTYIKLKQGSGNRVIGLIRYDNKTEG